MDASSKLDGQLLKLKEQREALKEGGAKHEDDIMKENARLQVRVHLWLGRCPNHFPNLPAGPTMLFLSLLYAW